MFGPVPSRRLGRSLGVDVVPFKTCSYDCIYCQLGGTTLKTVERKAWVPLDEVLQQVKDKLSSAPDYITLSGSGEPDPLLSNGRAHRRDQGRDRGSLWPSSRTVLCCGGKTYEMT